MSIFRLACSTHFDAILHIWSSSLKILCMVRFSMHVYACNSISVHPILNDAWLTTIYCPLCYNSRSHYPLAQFLRSTSAILPGTHSYFVVSSFKFIYHPTRVWLQQCPSWFWSMTSYIKGGTQAKGIWKQDPEANIWSPRGMRMGNGDDFTMRNIIVCTVHQT